MIKSRLQRNLISFLTWTLLICLVGGALLAVFHAGQRPVPDQPGRRLLITGSELVLGSLTGLALLDSYEKKQQANRWRQTLAAWEKNTAALPKDEVTVLNALSPGALKNLALQVYSRLGYQLVDSSVESEPAAYLLFNNPEGELELVCCQLQSEPVELRQIHVLRQIMLHENARRAFFWAPGGFSQAARYWASHAPVMLADGAMIRHIMISVLSA